MEQSDALKSYAAEKLERIKKYIDEPVVAQVYLTVEKIRHIVEITINAKGVSTKASEATNDMYASIDSVIDKIERQLRRYKERLKGHKPSEGPERQVQKTIISADDVDQSKESVVIKTKTVSLKPMSVDEAVMQMDLLHKDFLVFTDANSGHVNVIYRRRDGNFGLIETA